MSNKESKEYLKPQIKVTWSDTPDSFTPEKLKRVKAYFQEKYNTRHIRVITKSLSNGSNNKLKSLEISESILDPIYQKSLMKDFIKENDIKVNYEYIDKLDNRVNEVIFSKDANRVKYNRWYVKNVEFSNFLSFGENNKIDFTELDGITVVESTPRNFGGKSTSTVDLLLFLFFGTTTKTKTNGEIFNKFTDQDKVIVKGTVTIDGDDYVIERIISRKLNRSNEYTVKNNLEFNKILDNGEVQNLTGEQRRETEEFIKKAIGTQEDFLSTILTTGYNLEELIESKPTARGQILTKFIGLEALKEKEDVCREMYNEYRQKMVSNTNDKFTLQTEIKSLREEITDKHDEINKKEKLLHSTIENQKCQDKEKDNLLSEKHGDIDQELVKMNPKTIQNEVNDINDKVKKISATLKETEVKEPENYYSEDDHEKLSEIIKNIEFDIRDKESELRNATSEIKQLEEGSICPSCKRPLDDVDHTKEIKLKKDNITLLESTIEKIRVDLVKEKEKESGFLKLKKDYEQYEKNKLINTRYELEIRQLEMDRDDKLKRLDYYESNRKNHERNLEIDKSLIILKTQIETSLSDIKQYNILIERYKNEIKNLEEKIETKDGLIKRIDIEADVIVTYKSYMTTFGKNGISKTILRDMIPYLNNELEHLLDDSCYFKLEIKINDKNELDFIMIDSDTRIIKPLNAGSGYERTIASLAIRSVLTKVSSLPKPNIVVMDEVFGKIADENLEMVGEFFKKIKDYFEHIVVISHNPLIRTWSDNLLMVEKEENISSIKSISTKIS